jgi:hypothetical protein
MKIFVIFSLLLWVTLKVYCQDLIDSYRTAADYFNEIKRICEKDNGSLWGISLGTVFKRKLESG